MTPIQAFERRHRNPDAGALFAWAAWTVQSLHYLDRIDREHESSPAAAGRLRDIIDVAHARWATTASITAMDLCAAGLGRAFCGERGSRELKLGNFDLGIKLKKDAREIRAQRRKKLPVEAREWVDAACRDSRYKDRSRSHHRLVPLDLLCIRFS